MKQFGTNPPKTHVKVTPRAGVWIETQYSVNGAALVDVTPRAGVWIETITHALFPLLNAVTPRAGVWIETHSWYHHQTVYRCHSPCGSVD